MLHHPTSPTAAKSKIRPAVVPVGSVTLSDGRGPGERTPTRRSVRAGWRGGAACHLCGCG